MIIFLISLSVTLGAGSASASADELDCWIWRSPRPHNQQIFALARGGGLWLCLGHNGTVATSIDGVDWDLANVGTNSPVVAGAYGNGVFVASAPVRGLYRSADAPDGLAWTPRTPTTTNNLRAIAYGNGAFVATGDRGAILNSADAVMWSDLSRNTTRSLRGVAYGAGWWVIVATPSSHYTSPDGVNWTFRTSLNLATLTSPYGVAFGGDSFLVTGSFGQILESFPFNPPAQDTALKLRYTSVPFLTLTGPECHEYEIQSSDTLTPAPGVGVPWQALLFTHNFHSASGNPKLNPNGIPSQSPGLRGTSYPGFGRLAFNNPKGGCDPKATFASSRNPFGVHSIPNPCTQGSRCAATPLMGCSFRLLPEQPTLRKTDSSTTSLN